MPTVAELISGDGPLEVELCAGATGLGREIARIVHLGAGRLDVSLQAGDLVLISLQEWRRVSGSTADKSLDNLGSLPVAAVLVAASPSDAARAISEAWSTPVLFLAAPRLDRAESVLRTWLSHRQQHEMDEAIQIREAFLELGDDPTLEAIAERVAQLACKAVLLHDGRGAVDRVCQPISGARGERDFESAVRAAALTISWRLRQELFPAIGMLYDEVPAAELCLLTVATGHAQAQPRYLSLLVNPAESQHRDRAILGEALDVLLEDTAPAASVDAVEARDGLVLASLLKARFDQARTRALRIGYQLEGSHSGLAVAIPPTTDAAQVRERLCELLAAESPLIGEQDDCVLCLLPATQSLADHWGRHRKLGEWYGALCASFGDMSAGASAAHNGPVGARLAVVEARRALEIGHRLCGPGHLSHYPDMCVREFLLSSTDPERLRALRDTLLHPLTTHEDVSSNDLVLTLRTHLQTGCRTVQTAELLGVHRNSILYRVQRIEELLQLDLADPDTRLLLYLAIRATDVLPAMRSSAPDGLTTPSIGVIWSRGDGTRLSQY